MLPCLSLTGWWNVSFSLPLFLLRRAEEHFEQAQVRWSQEVADASGVRARAERFRRFFLETLGGLPGEAPQPLSVEWVGEVRGKGFIVRKVIYESLPQFFVTAVLLVPERVEGKAPAILLVPGHFEWAKVDQALTVGVPLACNGFVVLAIDCLGQGERKSYYDPQTGAERIRWGTREHDYDGVRCQLLGTSIARYFIWDAMCGLSLLQSLPFVDGQRIGITGISGGGTQTCLMMVAERRLAAAAPACYVTGWETYINTFNPIDAEQVLPGLLANGFDFHDYFVAFAPKPAMLVATAYDFFPIEGALRTYERAREAYRALGAEERMEHFVHLGGHSDEGLVEPRVRFFLRHLKGSDAGFVPPPAEVGIGRDDLWCLPHRQLRADRPQSRRVFEVNRELGERLWANRAPLRSRAQAQALLRRLLAWREERPPLHPRLLGQSKVEVEGMEVASWRIFLFTEPDALVTGVLYRPASAGPTPLVLLVLEDGVEDLRPRDKEPSPAEVYIREQLKAGRAVLVWEPRGVGTTQVTGLGGGNPKDFYGIEHVLSTYALLLGRPLVGLRAWDVARGMDFARWLLHHRALPLAEANGEPVVHLAALGPTASLHALLAAVMEPAFASVELREALPPLSHVITEEEHRLRPYQVLPGLLRSTDLPELLRLLETNP